MKKRFNKLEASTLGLASLLTTFLLVSIHPTLTLADIDQATARKLSASGQVLPLEKIHEKARAIKPGKVLESELENKHGQYVYEVELLDDKGIVWEIKLNAKTGQLIKLEED